MRTRANVFSQKGVVSTSTIQASMEGARIVEKGGNVADAAITSSTVLAVTHNDACGLGGDLFALLKINGKSIVDINGSGKSSHNTSITLFRERGLKKIPKFGGNSALTVPGIVDALNIIHKNFATMELNELLEPAIRLAREGFPVTHSYVDSIYKAKNHLGTLGWGKVFTPSGKIPRVGSVFKQPDLAETLSLIAKEGPDTFYNGFLADKILKGLENTEVVLDEHDFKTHSGMIGQPLVTDYKGHKIYENNPNSQGATVLLWLNLFKTAYPSNDELSIKDKIRMEINTGQIAYSQRAKHIGDTDNIKLPTGFLSDGYSEDLLEKPVGREVNGDEVNDLGDTTYFAIADTDGNSASVIQSNFNGFGSGIVPEGTGFVLQNRGSYFSLNENHHNRLRPSTRTFHTLTAAMAEDCDGEIQFSLGTMGGDIQPQIQFQLIRDIVDEGLDPQLAIDRPRWSFPHSIYENPASLRIEKSFPLDSSITEILNMLITRIPDLSPEMGQAQIIQRNISGVVIGGADPRGDGFAIPVQ